jgi:hypothetical protein
MYQQNNNNEFSLIEREERGDFTIMEEIKI